MSDPALLQSGGAPAGVETAPGGAPSPIALSELENALTTFLPRQRWFAARQGAAGRLVIDRLEVIRRDWPGLLRIETLIRFSNGANDRYQVPVGLRPAGSPGPYLQEGSPLKLGNFESANGPCSAYDALADPELALELLKYMAPEGLQAVQFVRPMGTDQSNTSMVFDDRIVLKVFRKLSEGPNLEVEMLRGLTDAGFSSVAEVLATWSSNHNDLGLLQRFVAGGTEGRAVAKVSLRDHLAGGGDPAEAGGDFGPDAQRLGEMTAQMHRALGQAFGMSDPDPRAWADFMDEQLDRIDHPGLNRDPVANTFEALRNVDDPGPCMRVHGDYHLGQVLRTDAGWFVFDFEGEPSRPTAQRRLPTSPLKDVAGMLRSLDYAGRTFQLEQPDKPPDLAHAWVRRNRRAFLDGYVAAANQTPGMLPADTASFDTVLRAFEADKAVYEVGYEAAHRPNWVGIPLAALPHI